MINIRRFATMALVICILHLLNGSLVSAKAQRVIPPAAKSWNYLAITGIAYYDYIYKSLDNSSRGPYEKYIRRVLAGGNIQYQYFDKSGFSFGADIEIGLAQERLETLFNLHVPSYAKLIDDWDAAGVGYGGKINIGYHYIMEGAVLGYWIPSGMPGYSSEINRVGPVISAYVSNWSPISYGILGFGLEYIMHEENAEWSSKLELGVYYGKDYMAGGTAELLFKNLFLNLQIMTSMGENRISAKMGIALK